jgi:hypothetical protein
MGEDSVAYDSNPGFSLPGPEITIWVLYRYRVFGQYRRGAVYQDQKKLEKMYDFGIYTGAGCIFTLPSTPMVLPAASASRPAVRPVSRSRQTRK